MGHPLSQRLRGKPKIKMLGTQILRGIHTGQFHLMTPVTLKEICDELDRLHLIEEYMKACAEETGKRLTNQSEM